MTNISEYIEATLTLLLGDGHPNERGPIFFIPQTLNFLLSVLLVSLLNQISLELLLNMLNIDLYFNSQHFQ